LRLLREKGKVEDFEYEAKTIDGRCLWFMMNASIKERHEEGSFIIEGFTFDISDRKQAADALKKSEAQYRLLADNTLDVIWTLNMDLVFAYVNPACLAMTGYTPEEWIGSRLQDHCDAANFEIMAENVAKGLAGGPDFPGVIFEAEMIKKNGDVFPVEIHGKIIFDAAGQPVMLQGVTRDITDRKKLLGQLLQAQKMESIGRLAGGVAHDFNNMLSVILGYAELALDGISPEDPLHEDILEIQSAGHRAADVTRQLLAFARRQTIAPKVMDLNETLESMLRMLRRLIGEDIDLAWHPRPGLWPVCMDPVQIDQILVNLCVNAKDAIAGVGKITIETDRKSFDEEYCKDHAEALAGDFTMLAVTDNGCGMDPATLANIYEPFFTTKGVGEGTGYGIVKQNNGFINVYSEPGVGTTFKLYFPRHMEAPAPVRAPVAEEILTGAGETILVVEDDPVVLSMAEKMLRSLNYRSLSATGPARALDLASAHEGEINLVMTDVIMPEMNGRELAERLKEHYPDLRVLFMSGYTANVIAHHGVLEDGVVFVPKPFSKADLAKKVRQALSQ
jgi:two-component system sensor histidine kinase EvgS